MPISRRRGRRVTPATIWAAAGVALLLHGALLGTVEALDVSLVGQGFSTRDRSSTVAAAPELQSNCVGDALLASSARFTICFAPWHDDTDACLRAAELDMRIDLSSCVVQRDPNAVASIAMLEPRATDKVTPIDPEPLLEALEEQTKPKPPEVPKLQPEQQQPPPAPPPPPPPRRPAQIVETARPTVEKAPDDARFLAEYDTNVEKQKVARGAVKEPMVAKSKPEELAAKQTPKELEVAKQDPDRAKGANKNAPDVPGTLAMRTPGAQNPAALQQDAKTAGSTTGSIGPLAFDGFVPRKGDGSFEQQQRERTEIPRGQTGAGGGAPDVLNLKPTTDVLERALGGGSVDHLDDVDNGDETALNAKRFIHATFFNRLKRAVAQNWDPASVWRRRDPTGQVYGFKTRVTEVRVSLSTKGELAKIVVTSPSGVTELDDEAVHAFQQAAPFVNPPKELASGDGLITFGFSFYFEIGQPRSSWRVVRSM